MHFGSARVTALHYLIEGPLRAVVPMPAIVKGFDLGLRLLAGRSAEKNVVAGLAVERPITATRARQTKNQ